MNLNADPAEWNCWELHARTMNRDVFIIIMRRKYIPPLMENFQDIVIILYGPIGFKTEIPNDEKRKDKDKEKEKGKKHLSKTDKELLLEALEDAQNEAILKNILRGIADSMTST